MISCVPAVRAFFKIEPLIQDYVGPAPTTSGAIFLPVIASLCAGTVGGLNIGSAKAGMRRATTSVLLPAGLAASLGLAAISLLW